MTSERVTSQPLCRRILRTLMVDWQGPCDLTETQTISILGWFCNAKCALGWVGEKWKGISRWMRIEENGNVF